MNPLRKLTLGLLKKIKILPPPVYMKIYYEYYHDKKLNLKNPQDFNEKIQWLKVYFKPDILTKLVDKYEVRSYVEKKIGKQYLNDLLGLYDRVSEIDFNKLPSQFVLKTTHGYNNNIIVRDKNKLNKIKTKLKLFKWMHRNHYYRGGLEWAYKNVPHRIIAENYISEIDNKGISDFKFYCFNGKPDFIEVNLEFNSKKYRCYFDTNWKPLDFGRLKVPMYKGKLEKPKNLDQMIEVAYKLSQDFPFVRVDLYDVEGKILFGELTFYPADGRHPFYPEEYNKIIGNKMNLPQVTEGQKVIKKI